MSVRGISAPILGLLCIVPILAAAAQTIPSANPDILARSLVASPHRITEKVANRKLRFVLTRADGNPLSIVRTAEQSFKRVDGKAVVTVCFDCGDERATTQLQASAFLAPNAWVQSRDPLVRQLAARAGRPDETVDRRMKRLLRIVERRLEGVVNDVEYTDAVQSLRNGRGDCTEFALVLAAMARSQGIPARIVYGMAYASRFTGRKDVFAPHVWVQVWDKGKWTSYDAALGRFDSTHIAFAIGTGDPADVSEVFAQLRQLKIEQFGVITR